MSVLTATKVSTLEFCNILKVAEVLTLQQSNYDDDIENYHQSNHLGTAIDVSNAVPISVDDGYVSVRDREQRGNFFSNSSFINETVITV